MGKKRRATSGLCVAVSEDVRAIRQLIDRVVRTEQGLVVQLQRVFQSPSARGARIETVSPVGTTVPAYCRLALKRMPTGRQHLWFSLEEMTKNKSWKAHRPNQEEANDATPSG